MKDSDLKITICCDCNFCHEWMAFASYYSIKKYLPDCEVSLQVNLNKPIFRWANRLGVKIFKNNSFPFKINPTIMAVRDFYGDLTISPAKSSTQTTFVDYSEGCGNFVVNNWINTSKVPFFKALRRFGNEKLTVNEVAILTIWEKCHYVYLSAGGA